MGLSFRASTSITLKALTIGAIVLLLLIPLSMLSGLVSERSSLREQAYARVAEGWGGNIAVGGPMLIVPTEQIVFDGEKTRTLRTELYLLPAKLKADLHLGIEAEPRKVGIYEVPVYLSDARLSGEFDFSALVIRTDKPDATLLWQEARLLLPLSQVRSLREVQQAQLASQELKLGPARPSVLPGIEAPVDLRSFSSGGVAEFDFKIVVAGSRELSLLPLGSETQAALQSNWPHPSFVGAFLPARRAITDEGFTAQWQVLELNRTYRQTWMDGEVDGALLMDSAFGVSLYQAIDVYQRGERAVKYALLFIALTFLAFFAWEQLSGTRLHPLQYLLVGLALSTFYLLLIALSEHIAYWIAYVTAAGALVVLIGFYLAGALGGGKHGFTAATAMSAVYGVLYVLVLSEDYALVLGAITLFAALAAVMLITRKLNWYELGEDRE